MQTERNTGFSLIEVMIAVAIFAIMILAIGQAAVVGQAAANEVKEQTNILLGCQQVMEQLLQMPLSTLLLQNGSTFSLRIGGPDAPLEPGGSVVVDKDLNGNGTLETGSLYRENRSQNDLLRVALYYKGKLVLQRVIARRY